MEATITKVNEQGVLGTHEIDLTKNTEQRYKDYQALQNEEFLGIPTGFSKIDEATAGLQGGQLITIIAPPKTGKSQIALKMAVNVHTQGFIPMFQSFEMNNHEQQQRHDAMRANISHSRLRRGKLLPAEEDRYIEVLNKMETEPSFHLIDAVSGITVSALAAKIEQTKPDIVFVDGVYLMLDEVSGEMNTPQAITNVTRSLKRLAQRINKPIIITKETNPNTLKILEDEYVVYPYTKAICQALILPVPKVTIKEIAYEEVLEFKSDRMLGMLGSSGA
jgi:replicative DNA helicase